MGFFDDGTDEEYYKHINQTVIAGNVINMFFIGMEGNYCSVDADDS